MAPKANPAAARAERKVAAESPKRPKRQFRDLGEPAPAAATDVAPLTIVSETEAPAARLISIEVQIDQLFPSPLNPRRAMDPERLQELAESIIENGILQPLLVRPMDLGGVEIRDGQGNALPPYEIIMGARRHAAAALAAREGRLPEGFRIPVRVRAATDAELVWLAAAENLARADMDPLDEAKVFQALRQQGASDQEIARKLGVNVRTLFRRLQLLNLAPEVEAALLAKRITLQQAQALAAGPAAMQAQAVKRVQDAQWGYHTPAAIRQAITRDLPPVKCAQFPLEQYTGDFFGDVDDPDGRCFADLDQFRRLQTAAVQTAVAKLRSSGRHAWVDVVSDNTEAQKYEYANKSDPEALYALRGLVVISSQDLRRYEVISDRYRPKTRAAFARGDGRAMDGPKGLAAEAAREPLTVGQKIALHTAKTQAIRCGMARPDSDRRIGLALAILGCCNAPELMIETRQRFGNDAMEDVGLPAELDACFAPVAAHLPEDMRATLRPRGIRIASGDYGQMSDADAAALYRAMMACGPDELLDLLQVLVALRFASWPGYEPKAGQTPLAIAVALDVRAAAELEAIWQPDEAFLRAYGNDQLHALALSVGDSDTARLQKKGERVKELAALPPGTFAASRMAECAFAPTGAIERAMLNRRYVGPVGEPPLVPPQDSGDAA